MIIGNKFILLLTIISLAAAVFISPYVTSALPNREGKPGDCLPTGGQSGPHGASVVKCCWMENVPPGTGAGGTDKEFYCQECEDGGTRGYINCTDPELQYRDGKPAPPLSSPLNNGEIADEPANNNDVTPGLPIKGGETWVQDNGGIVSDEQQPPTKPLAENDVNIPDNGGVISDEQQPPTSTHDNNENVPPTKGIMEDSQTTSDN